MRSKEIIIREIEKLVIEYNGLSRIPSQTNKIPVGCVIHDEKEQLNLIDVALSFKLAGGEYTQQFEECLAEYLGIKHVAAVNSGSSANLLAFMALTSSELGERAIRSGDEVICVAMAYPTTVSPILQCSAIPVFVDIELGTYNVDASKLEGALSAKTKCVFVAHTLGNPINLKRVKDFCDRNNLWLIEDNCDSLGAEYDFGQGFKKTGTIGDIGTSSFYPAHHITTGEGGAVYTDNSLLFKIIVSLRDWGRHCICPPGKDNTCGHRFEGKFGLLPEGYDHKYVYSNMGFNMKMTEMQAAIGVAQLQKLPELVRKRRENYRNISDRLSSIKGKIILPREEDCSRASWFGYPITINSTIERKTIIDYLESRGIQTRMLFAGNLLWHPCFQDKRYENMYRISDDLHNTERVVYDSFWVSCNPGLDNEKCDYMCEAIKEVVNRF